jgi:hypothetical protein
MNLRFVNENGQPEVFNIASDKSAYLYAAAIGLLLGGIIGYATSFFH